MANDFSPLRLQGNTCFHLRRYYLSPNPANYNDDSKKQLKESYLKKTQDVFPLLRDLPFSLRIGDKETPSLKLLELIVDT